MEIEKQRGISVTSSVMQFQYKNYCINILDTPGHQDFSEDTYRTLMAADSAVMVIDASKGVENQTRKLFKVCVMRHIPIFTFVNKMDRESRNPFDLMEQIESELGIQTYPVNWPIGSGKEFKGVYDRDKKAYNLFLRQAVDSIRWQLQKSTSPTRHLTALSARISTQLSAMISSFSMAQAMSSISKKVKRVSFRLCSLALLLQTSALSRF